MFGSLKRSCVLHTGLSVVQDDGILKVFKRTLHCSKAQRLAHTIPLFPLSAVMHVIGDIPLMWTKNNLCPSLKIPTTVFPNYQFTLWISHRKKVLPPKGLRRKHGYATGERIFHEPVSHETVKTWSHSFSYDEQLLNNWNVLFFLFHKHSLNIFSLIKLAEHKLSTTLKWR